MTVNTWAIESLTTFLQKPKTPKYLKTKQGIQIQKKRKQNHRIGKIHLGQLVGGTASDLGYAEESELGLEILQLRQKVGLGLLPQLVYLDSSCHIFKNTQNQKTPKFEREPKKWFKKLVKQSESFLGFRVSTHCCLFRASKRRLSLPLSLCLSLSQYETLTTRGLRFSYRGLLRCVYKGRTRLG